MKREQISAMIGIVLVFVIAFGFIAFCKVTDDNVKKSDFKHDGGESTGDIVTGVSWADRGYTVYRPLPDQVQKLFDTDVFAPTEESAKVYKEYSRYYEEEDDKKTNDEDFLAEQKRNYEESKELMKEVGNPELLEQNEQLVFGPKENGLECVWEWDAAAGKLKDRGMVSAIEGCGFTGFSDLISEVEHRIKDKKAKLEETGGHVEEDVYTVFCQGTPFVISDEYTEKYYNIRVQLNSSACYIPEKYRNVIDRVNAGSGYFFYSSCVGGKKDVLVFCRDNSISEGGKASNMNNKRIALIFEEGELIDFYAASAAGQLHLDDVDQQFLDKYTEGLDKTLDTYGEESGYKAMYLYRSK